MRHCARNRRCAQNVECAQSSESGVQCTFGRCRFVSPKCIGSLIYDMSFNYLALCIMPLGLPTLWRETKWWNATSNLPEWMTLTVCGTRVSHFCHSSCIAVRCPSSAKMSVFISNQKLKTANVQRKSGTSANKIAVESSCDFFSYGFF